MTITTNKGADLCLHAVTYLLHSMYQFSIFRLARSSLSLFDIVDDDGVVLLGGGVMVPLGGGGVIAPLGGTGGGAVLDSSIDELEDRSEDDLLLLSWKLYVKKGILDVRACLVEHN